MPQHAAQKMHLQADGITVHGGILNGGADFVGKFRRQNFVRIQQQNPVAGERKSVHRRLAFLRPASGIMKLNDGRAVSLRDRGAPSALCESIT